MDIHQAGSVPVLGIRRRWRQPGASLEHMEDGGRPGPLLDVSPLASAMSRCVALMDLLGKPPWTPPHPPQLARQSRQ